MRIAFPRLLKDHRCRRRICDVLDNGVIPAASIGPSAPGSALIILTDEN